jgi:hypothetical protein
MKLSEIFEQSDNDREIDRLKKKQAGPGYNKMDQVNIDRERRKEKRPPLKKATGTYTKTDPSKWKKRRINPDGTTTDWK